MLENQPNDIFTELDDSIFSDGSIDPMGLRIIWTSLGNRIFHNRLNTVSTDIRLYTINLFHHYLIKKCEVLFEDVLANIVGNPPYNNREDFRDGLIIFLECLLTHAVVNSNADMDEEENYVVPGTSKLSGIKLNKPSDPRAKYLSIDKKGGILVRQILLGIHGRYKGPFLQMGLLEKHNYYNNLTLWKSVGAIFQTNPWLNLENQITTAMEMALKDKQVKASAIKVSVNSIIGDSLIDAYKNILEPRVYKEGQIVKFWEDMLGLRSGNAGRLYAEVQNRKGDKPYQKMIQDAASSGSTEDVEALWAICAIEPFLTCLNKLIYRVLKRGTIHIDDDIIKYAEYWLRHPSISVDKIEKYLTKEYLNKEPLARLTILLRFYKEARDKSDYQLFIENIVAFHKEIMEERQNLPWISLGNNHSVVLHRAVSAEDGFFKNEEWMNSYYLPTLQNLYNGLY